VNGGADPKWVDDIGNILIHEAAKASPSRGNITIKRYFNAPDALGASSVVANYARKTPLHLVYVSLSKYYNT
jgi:hypothetical protein